MRALLALLLLAEPVLAHDSWISKGGYRNAKGEFCCGDNDCRIEFEAVARVFGWSVEGEGSASEFIPYSEAAPTHDGQLWVCRRPDGTRRCVFGLKPGL